MKTRPAHGLGLVELLVAVAILAILASLTLPTYSAYIARVRRASGRTALLQTAQWMERAATATGRYPDPAQIPPGLLRPADGYYQLRVEFHGPTFQLLAEPAGAQAGDACGTLGLSQSGARTSSHESNADACWNR
ncbi:prepilin-type N-terminal cleavage/methylation domain-containing protein [Xylophilus rhododendri]|uniref:Prepilin-type N-terminal cleavage/methylation domain-containing protein n=1 Tax=Xylophilus rhododendri TaxID=2697032 RepID=A0A857J0K7_9BURK|nr:type IV pilin protein [Xylophilus rhododendri]QHI96632.1 prepilin-type N-terminal cleavage/methylation domain-containing protein [Xylophilus rhododendri]